MKKNLKMTPEGTKDFLFAECSAMDYICTSIEKVFVKGGFKRVITPALEFYDVFSIPSSGISQESMFKTTDNKGRLLVARPDSTLPMQEWFLQDLKTIHFLFDFTTSRQYIATIRHLQEEETNFFRWVLNFSGQKEREPTLKFLPRQ